LMWHHLAFFDTMLGVMCLALYLALWGEPPARAMTAQVFTIQKTSDNAKNHAQVKTLN